MRYNISEGVDGMEKNATLNIRINPDVKKSAETVLSQLGVPMATAVDMFLKQVTLTGGIPFSVTLPKAPESVNADMMSVSQIREKLAEGLSDVENGKVRSAKETFKRFKESHPNEAL
jgi:addiction module RelB/DinJ family antitoxin